MIWQRKIRHGVRVDLMPPMEREPRSLVCPIGRGRGLENDPPYSPVADGDWSRPGRPSMHPPKSTGANQYQIDMDLNKFGIEG
jgi:hypothetical protein